MPEDLASTARLPRRDALHYGLLGAPLAFVALPLAVHWPAHAASATGLSLASLGTLLLAARSLDAFVDPWLGRRADALLAAGGARAIPVMALGCAALTGGFAMLFVAPSLVDLRPEGWMAASIGALTLAYLGYSLVSVAHQAWGARWGGSEGFRASVVASREIFALGGVVAASVLPALVGWATVTAVLAVMLAVGLILLRTAPATSAVPVAVRDLGPVGPADATGGMVAMGATAAAGIASRSEAIVPTPRSPLRNAGFRALLLTYTLSSLGAALPATLVLFFVRDRLALPAYEGAFLLAYFVVAALSVPAWTRVVRSLGLVRAWALGMALAIMVFAFAAVLGEGDAAGFALVCIGSGAALGAKVVAPAALLTGVIAGSGGAGRDEGLWFGWWNLAGKLALALAGGISLPLVHALGYRPGDAASTGGLVVVYALVPCVLEALALVTLLLHRRRAQRASNPSSQATRTAS